MEIQARCAKALRLTRAIGKSAPSIRLCMTLKIGVLPIYRSHFLEFPLAYTLSNGTTGVLYALPRTTRVVLSRDVSYRRDDADSRFIKRASMTLHGRHRTPTASVYLVLF